MLGGEQVLCNLCPMQHQLLSHHSVPPQATTGHCHMWVPGKTPLLMLPVLATLPAAGRGGVKLRSTVRAR